MYSYWSPMQWHNMAQQPSNQGFFQCQQSFPGMCQQQSQSSSSNFAPFPNNFNGPKPTMFPSNGYFMYPYNNNSSYGPHPQQSTYPSEKGKESDKINYAQNNNSSYGPHPQQSTYPSEKGRESNRINYAPNPNEVQYVSYPNGAVYRYCSGPGWHRQETFYSS